MFKNIHILECGQKWGYNMWEFTKCVCVDLKMLTFMQSW